MAEVESIRPFGPARSTVKGEPLSKEEIELYNDFFKASCYLSLGMIYLKENPLLRDPLKGNHLKTRLLGHFGSALGQICTYMHFNRPIKKHDLNAIFISGPGYGAPAVLSQSYLEGVYFEKFFKSFSFPSGIGSYATPETLGSLYECGELGYSISHAFGTVFNSPNLIALTIVGDGEAETGHLATAWHSNKFLNPIVDGAVLPPYFVEGDDIETMHQAMAATLEHCGWTGPRKVDNNYLAGFWRAHQVPITDPATNPQHLKILEEWMRSYEPDRLFDESGKPIPSLRALCPDSNRHMSVNPIANGGQLRKPLKMPNFKDYAIKFLWDVIAANQTNFRLFGPDETESNKLGGYFEEDENGGNLAKAGCIMEMLSEHTCEGWLEGYILSGRHGLLNSYKPFIYIIDSMVNQIEKRLKVEWRYKVASLNILLTAVIWRQDHNGFTHQDPGFLDVVANKSPEVMRIYLPPDGNCLLSVMDHCFRSINYINIIMSDKQKHLQYLSIDAAIMHCTKGIDISTYESLAAIDLLLQHFPELKICCVNCVDLFKLIHPGDHPHGLTDKEWMVHRLTYRRPGSKNLHVRGYKEKGNIDTPLELAIRNQTDRFSLSIDAIDWMPKLHNRGAAAREAMLNAQIAARNQAFETGMDSPFLKNWTWKRNGQWNKVADGLASR
ncbi:XFP N-terminal domain-containing protein [Dactylonectria estremocensis]|uniref:XFP N-terminal domain-containing protein n=1 Tax=Dactylonectria estremocensis TaxID=1079267 RepID=A0A9P9EXA2_9HYPO|nr:XFP N-terminal domain-containing protein [Dactylonectria estremocensis]